MVLLLGHQFRSHILRSAAKEIESMVLVINNLSSESKIYQFSLLLLLNKIIIAIFIIIRYNNILQFYIPMHYIFLMQVLNPQSNFQKYLSYLLSTYRLLFNLLLVRYILLQMQIAHILHYQVNLVPSLYLMVVFQHILMSKLLKNLDFFVNLLLFSSSF